MNHGGVWKKLIQEKILIKKKLVMVHTMLI